jgi:peptidoglycan/xylan/chitin deacetylase (PgdA/CDA1 family)
VLNHLAHVLLSFAGRTKSGGVIVNEHCVTRTEIAQRVEMLGRYFEFIHHDDLLRRLSSPRQKPFCLLTFDDGKRNNVTCVAPELERLGVPAVFYVTTGFIESSQPLWFDQYEALIRIVRNPPGLSSAVVKRLPHTILKDRLNRACLQADVVCDMKDDDIGAMTWDDLRLLTRKGFSVGAHTVNHPVLTCLADYAAFEEIGESIRTVRKQLGFCPTFAFTNGNYTARLARYALSQGVQTVTTTEPVWATRHYPAWRLPRVQLHSAQPRWKMQLKLAVAAAGCILENPDGTGRVYARIQRVQRRQLAANQSQLREGSI